MGLVTLPIPLPAVLQVLFHSCRSKALRAGLLEADMAPCKVAVRLTEVAHAAVCIRQLRSSSIGAALRRAVHSRASEPQPGSTPSGGGSAIAPAAPCGSRRSASAASASVRAPARRSSFSSCSRAQSCQGFVETARPVVYVVDTVPC